MNNELNINLNGRLSIKERKKRKITISPHVIVHKMLYIRGIIQKNPLNILSQLIRM